MHLVDGEQELLDGEIVFPEIPPPFRWPRYAKMLDLLPE